jgi:RNA polymerase sigma-70 factor (sigma-E family)
MDADAERDFERFVRARGDRLVRFALLLTGDLGVAEDVVQEVLARMALRWQKVHGVDNLDAYVHRAIVNTAASSWRRAWRSHEEPVGVVPDAVGSELREYDDAVVAALRALAPRQRATVLLRYFEDHSEATTARILGCSIGTVKSQNAKALATLSRLLSTDFALDEGLRR